MRLRGLAIVCAGLVSVGSARAQDSSTVPDAASVAWQILLNTNGWMPLSTSNDTYVYSRPFVGAAHASRLWVRWEFQKPTGYPPVASSATVEEADCGSRKLRAIQETTYASSNMTGVEQEKTIPSAWEFEIPGTIGEQIISAICDQPPPDSAFVSPRPRKKPRPALSHPAG